MTLLSDTAISNTLLADNTTSSGLAQHRYQKALELEKQLRALIQAKGPFDPNVRVLRNSIREGYESVILEDYEFAELYDVEQSLWRLHYKRIEEFRARIRKSVSSSAPTTSGSPVATSGSKAGSRREPLHKILAVFRSFLSEATGFYHDLILRIRAKHGLSQDYLSWEGIEGIGTPNDEKKAKELKSCQVSCHRCLIYLGDLARYKELHGEGDPANHDWSVAAGYYVKAASLWPSSGNPHNQLAVLATYIGDELLAVYRYFRSLAAETPFLTARDNLILLFEKNRQHYVQLVAQVGETISASHVGPKIVVENKGKARGDKLRHAESGNMRLTTKEAITSQATSSVNIAEALKKFRIYFVRLNGILFTRTSLETFPEVYSSALHQLEELFGSNGNEAEAGFGSDFSDVGGTSASGPALGLQLIAILIFTVHNVNWGPDAQQPTYAEILQRSALFQHAATAAFECAGYLMERCADIDDASLSPLLPAMLIFMEWLVSRPGMANGTEFEEKQADARMSFWKKCVNLLNKFSNTEVNKGKEGNSARTSLNTFGEANDREPALWEDYELCGFTPLASAQLALDYSQRPTVGLGNKKERKIRIQRFVAAAKALASAFEENEKGIFYDKETERFYVTGDGHRKKIKKETVGVVIDETPPAVTSENLTDLKSGVESFKVQMSRPNLDGRQVMPSDKPALPVMESGEDEDEVIVFKPLVKEKKIHVNSTEPAQSHMNKAGMYNPVVNSNALGCSRTVVEDTDAMKDMKQQTVTTLSPQLEGIDKQMSMPSTSNFTTDTTARMLPNPSVLLHQQTSCAVSGVCSATPASGFSKALSFMGSAANSVLDSSFKDLNLKDRQDSLKSTLNVTGFEGGWLNAISGGSSAMPGASALSAWGIGSNFDSFYNQGQRIPILGNINERVVDFRGSNSLWSTDTQMLAPNGLPGLRFANPDLSLGDKMPMTNFMPNFPMGHPFEKTIPKAFEVPVSVSRPLTSGLLTTVTPNLNEDHLHRPLQSSTENKHSSQVLMVAGDTGTSLDEQVVEEAGTSKELVKPIKVSSPLIKPVGGSINSKEKMTTSNVVRTSSMRPPPGFGPIPARPPVAVPVPSLSGASQSTSGGHITIKPTVMLQAGSQPHNSGSALDGQVVGEGDEQQHVDDYGWLDGYTPVKKEANKVENVGQVLPSKADFGIWSTGSNSATDVAAFPFPGMRLSDGYAPQQQQTLIAQLRQQVLQQHQHQQLLQEQKHQQLLQEQQQKKLEQYQQLYGMQLLAEEEQLRQQQVLAQQQQRQQQQQPQSLWQGQNYARDPFVS